MPIAGYREQGTVLARHTRASMGLNSSCLGMPACHTINYASASGQQRSPDDQAFISRAWLASRVRSDMPDCQLPAKYAWHRGDWGQQSICTYKPVQQSGLNTARGAMNNNELEQQLWVCNAAKTPEAERESGFSKSCSSADAMMVIPV